MFFYNVVGHVVARSLVNLLRQDEEEEKVVVYNHNIHNYFYTSLFGVLDIIGSKELKHK